MNKLILKDIILSLKSNGYQVSWLSERYGADMLHVLKLAKNHFNNKGFVLKGDEIEKDCTAITKHIHLRILEDKTWKQLFSNSVSNVKTFLQQRNCIAENAQPTAKVIQFVNDWFDVYSSRCFEVYDTKLEEQDSFLNE
ncbi:hypothetical protein PR048_000787 [Dryococelus australis]|uniref:Transposable element P transposase-like GTP-binding insertion domain-containing protein n=1 Tax=Dryococelus australis TaxID=614101 RepID=A0ABQ9IFN1_9NEOP|nr:hypothetical protein PR048_000787 [Dryococelus australis]